MIAELDRAAGRRRKLADVTLNLQKAQAEFTTRAARLHAQPRAVRARTCAPPSITLEEKKLAQGAGQVRGADDQATGRDRLREGAARARAVEAQPRHEDQAGRREDVVRRRGPRPPAEQPQEHPGRAWPASPISAPAPGMVIYVREWNGKKKGVGSQWNAVGPDGRHAARPHADGVADLRQRSRRPEARASARRSQISLDADPTKKLAGTVTQHRERRRAAAQPGLEGVRGEDRGREGRHHAAPGHDDVERDRDRVDAERAVGAARGGGRPRAASPTSTRRTAAAS